MNGARRQRAGLLEPNPSGCNWEWPSCPGEGALPLGKSTECPSVAHGGMVNTWAQVRAVACGRSLVTSIFLVKQEARGGNHLGEESEWRRAREGDTRHVRALEAAFRSDGSTLLSISPRRLPINSLLFIK